MTVDPRQSSYVAMSDCHRAVASAAADVKATIVFAGPDMLYARGAFARVRDLIDDGKKAIFVPCIRLSRDAFVRAFVARYGHGSVGPRELTRLALQHLHPWTTANFWPARGVWPSNLFWPVGDEGLVARLFHSHSLAVVANRRGASFVGTSDDDFVDLAWPDECDRYVVQDSDELCTYELSADSHMRDTLTDQVCNATIVADWAAYHAVPTHRWLFQHSIRIHAGACSQAWNDVEAASAQDAAAVFDCLACEKPWAAQLKRSAVQAARRVKLPRFVRRAGKAALTYLGRKMR